MVDILPGYKYKLFDDEVIHIGALIEADRGAYAIIFQYSDRKKQWRPRARILSFLITCANDGNLWCIGKSDLDFKVTAPND